MVEFWEVILRDAVMERRSVAMLNADGERVRMSVLGCDDRIQVKFASECSIVAIGLFDDEKKAVGFAADTYRVFRLEFESEEVVRRKVVSALDGIRRLNAKFRGAHGFRKIVMNEVLMILEDRLEVR